jgi:biotin-dependent carboxylase-like uncharacterized protein
MRGDPAFVVDEPGPLATIQDYGRPGNGRRGIAPSGAFDRPALDLANRLVGNRDGDAAVEILFGPFEATALGPLVVAACGTDAVLSVDGRASSTACAIRVPDGARFTVGRPRTGARTVLAVRGGIGVTPYLASRSWDSSSRVGPPPLAAGDVVPTGRPGESAPWFELVAHRPASGPVAVISGPRADWLDPGGFDTLVSTPWRVAASSDRIGVRLTGPALARRSGELPSEAMIPGAVQLPPDGQPIVLGPDCGVTGGYPVIAVVVGDGLAAIAQARPGDEVRFTTHR